MAKIFRQRADGHTHEHKYIVRMDKVKTVYHPQTLFGGGGDIIICFILFF